MMTLFRFKNLLVFALCALCSVSADGKGPRRLAQNLRERETIELIHRPILEELTFADGEGKAELHADSQTLLSNFLIAEDVVNLPRDDDMAEALLMAVEQNITPLAVASVDAAWAYNTDMTEENANAMNDASLAFSQAYQYSWENVFSVYDYHNVSDPFIKRQYEMQQSIGTAILSEEDLTSLNFHITAMTEAYSNKVCPFDDMKCEEETEGRDIDSLEVEMSVNRDYSELLYYWEEWRDASGREMIDDFEQYVQLLNKSAQMNGFTDAGAMWLEPYTTYNADWMDSYTDIDFKMDVEDLWQTVAEYYGKLHAYVRYKLQQNEEYEKHFEDDGLIPAHILGNMWAQSWENIYDIVAPYPEVPLLDISETLEEVNDVHKMFRIAEDFFTSIGMFPMTDDFWENSMFVQPEDRQVVCHASAWDFYSTGPNITEDGRFRIKMCTNANQEDFIVIHHEMGHNEYQMAYSDMPLIYRDGANPGFHEAIGDTIALSVSTPSHLNMIQDYLQGSTEELRLEPMKTKAAKEDPEYEDKQNINFLMKQALAKIAFLPYAYIMDQWRWEVFSGAVDREIYNKRWWELRIDYQGIRPPISRSAMEDFDIGAKYHVPASVPYIRYFVAHILQFQFHERLCSVGGVEGQLYDCDIYNNTESGNALLSLLSKGASEHWQDQLSEFMGTDDGDMNATSIINYFEPLWTFLDQQIEEHNLKAGWTASKEVIDDYIKENETISAIVPIVVGVVLAVLVCIVLVAFFVGQKRRKKMEEKRGNISKEEEASHPPKEESDTGKPNEALELDERDEAKEIV